MDIHAMRYPSQKFAPESVPQSPDQRNTEKMSEGDISVDARIFFFGKNENSSNIEQAILLCDSYYCSSISEEYVAYVSDNGHKFNTVFIVGSDPVRVRKFFKIYIPLFYSQAKIAFLRSSRPGIRAKLIRLGFDDVFDVRMDSSEQRARIAAIHRRLALAARPHNFHEALPNHLNFYVTKELSNREARALLLLVGSRGRLVRAQALRSTMRVPDNMMSQKSLAVLISNIRSKLKPAFRIFRFGNLGYALEHVNAVEEMHERISRSF